MHAGLGATSMLSVACIQLHALSCMHSVACIQMHALRCMHSDACTQMRARRIAIDAHASEWPSDAIRCHQWPVHTCGAGSGPHTCSPGRATPACNEGGNQGSSSVARPHLWSRIGSTNMQPWKSQPATNDWTKTARCMAYTPRKVSRHGPRRRPRAHAATKRVYNRCGRSASGSCGRSAGSSLPLRRAVVSVGMAHQNESLDAIEASSRESRAAPSAVVKQQPTMSVTRSSAAQASSASAPCASRLGSPARDGSPEN